MEAIEDYNQAIKLDPSLSKRLAYIIGLCKRQQIENKKDYYSVENKEGKPPFQIPCYIDNGEKTYYNNQSPKKPAIYLYPQKPTKININLDSRINLTLDVPKYVTNKGWNVLAYPDSKLVDLQPEYTDCNKLDSKRFGMEYAKEACLNNNYPYIYWEGDSFKNDLPVQNNGWLVKTNEIKEFLTTKLDYVGFNKAEKDEFIRYWVHKINELDKETVFISFMQTDAVNAYHPMVVTPEPDSVNRFYILVDPNIENHKKPRPQELIPFKRDGFTLVDWGGAIIGF